MLTWDGDVVPCCYDHDRRYVLGNVVQQSLKEIWNGGPMRSGARVLDAARQTLANATASMESPFATSMRTHPVIP